MTYRYNTKAYGNELEHAISCFTNVIIIFTQCENEKLVTIKRTRQLGNTKNSFFRAYATI